MSSAEFAEYLVRIAGVDDDQQPPVGMWAGTGNTIGAIALRMDLLELEQIDQILELQKQEGELFGQIAVRMGYLSQDQVDRLVQLQQVYQQLEIGGHYVVRQPQNQERPAH
jgi:hypothetical protein